LRERVGVRVLGGDDELFPENLAPPHPTFSLKEEGF
jgi:hypothetical protein